MLDIVACCCRKAIPRPLAIAAMCDVADTSICTPAATAETTEATVLQLAAAGHPWLVVNSWMCTWASIRLGCLHQRYRAGSALCGTMAATNSPTQLSSSCPNTWLKEPLDASATVLRS